MPAFTLVLTGIVAAYGLLALGAAALARRVRARPALPADALPAVSVLVAARDEVDALPACLAALQRQNYPADRFEVIVADDGSTDGTAAAADRFARTDGRFHRVAVSTAAPEDRLRGKARALHEACRRATGDVLLVTDADCTPPPDWARNLTSQFADPRAGVVCGVTTVAHASTLDRVQALDWLLLLTTAAAASGAGVPVTAMGNNMAFRRAAYEAVGGYPALPPSVTEDYALFRAVYRTRTWRVRLIPDARLRNVTRPLPTLRAAFSQRRRWARGGLRAHPGLYALYTVVYLTHVLLPAGLVAAPRLAAGLLVLKLTADLVVVRTGLRRLGERGLLRAFPAFEGYLFAYIAALPAALLLAPRIRWKGRTY